LYCNGYNSCGTQSDCPTEDEIDVVGIVIGSVALLIVVACFGTGVFFFKRKICRGMQVSSYFEISHIIFTF